jgi:hypothetical protein
MLGMSKRKPLGWREWIGLPGLNIPRIKAKIDTGARTSALHAFRVEAFTQDAQQWVRFAIHPIQGDSSVEVECTAAVIDRRLVRDSGGHEELRYVIDTAVSLGDDRFQCEVTLTDRDSMSFRVLLGRTALRGKYVIHPGRSYLQGNPATAE